jgi:hypothetical protein
VTAFYDAFAEEEEVSLPAADSGVAGDERLGGGVTSA